MLMLILKLNHRKKCIQLLTFLLLFSLMISVGAACLRPQIVCASVAGTIAGYILTLFASFNTAITNPEVVGAINSTFGQMSMIGADAAAIDQGIASIAASTGFDMASIFANTAEEAAQVIASAPAGSVLEGAEAIAATAGVNIAAGAGACAVSATGSVLPAIAGVVLPAAGAVALGVAGGVLINHIVERVKRNVQLGFNINDNVGKIPSNAVVASYFYNSSNNLYGLIYSTSPYVSFYCINNGNQKEFKAYNNADSRQSFNRAGSWININSKSDANIVSSSNPNFYTDPSLKTFDSLAAYNAYIDNIKNGNAEVPGIVSPDLIGKNGNQSVINNNMPYVNPVYNYGDTIINYINPTDYNTFVQNANQNTVDGLTGEDTQGDYFDNFVNPYIQRIDETPENPDPENPDPEQKPTVPYPDPEEYPDAIPEVNPVPDTDIAPTAIPYPELPEPTDEEITETNDKITPFDLKNKFPFCLPFDIHKALLKLKGAREAPYFVWQIPFGDAGQQTVTVDLSAWDDVASILRLLELLLFIVGLAVATRNLIGGT